MWGRQAGIDDANLEQTFLEGGVRFSDTSIAWSFAVVMGMATAALLEPTPAGEILLAAPIVRATAMLYGKVKWNEYLDQQIKLRSTQNSQWSDRGIVLDYWH